MNDFEVSMCVCVCVNLGRRKQKQLWGNRFFMQSDYILSSSKPAGRAQNHQQDGIYLKDLWVFFTTFCGDICGDMRETGMSQKTSRSSSETLGTVTNARTHTKSGGCLNPEDTYGIYNVSHKKRA